MLIRFFISSVTCAILLGGCSYNYNELSNIEEREPTNFQEQIFVEYKREATFEAEQMHDWNSADLYSKKAIKSLETDNIYPEEIDHWKLPKDKVKVGKILPNSSRCFFAYRFKKYINIIANINE